MMLPLLRSFTSSNYDSGTKQALNRPNNLQHAHKYANVNVGRDSVVGIATRYGLDGPGIESRWEARFSADLSWGAPNFLYSVYRVFPGGKAAGAWR